MKEEDKRRKKRMRFIITLHYIFTTLITLVTRVPVGYPEQTFQALTRPTPPPSCLERGFLGDSRKPFE